MNGTPERKMSGGAQSAKVYTGTGPRKLTQGRLKKLVYYNPDTGELTWKSPHSKKLKPGDACGFVNGRGYSRVMIDGKSYQSHRIAWLYVHGYMPEKGIDHINRKRHDNRILNLREASQQCNARNTGNPKNNTSLVKGVYWHKGKQKWYSSIYVGNERKFLGIYKSFNDAVCARLAGEQCLDWSGCDSNSPAFIYVQKLLKGGTYE